MSVVREDEINHEAQQPINFDDLGPVFYQTEIGKAYLNDSLNILRLLPTNSINLIMTSPPFALIKQKEYGNVSSDEYIDWFRPFAKEMHRILTDNGSLVIDIGGTWNKGYPTRSLYHFELLITLVKEYEFHLAQEFFWYNPSKLPTPAQWVTIERVRVKDAVNTVWWLSKTPHPKANNRNILKPYSESMKQLIKNGYKPNLRPSGHNISDKFQKDNDGAIPPNLIVQANTESNSSYMKLCKENNIKAHPARFPSALPEQFIKFLTDVDDIVLDPFAGSNTTGEVAERTNRRWISIELSEEYLQTSKFRFENV